MAERWDHNHRPRVGPFIGIRGGRQFWPLDPRPEDFNVEDIAYGLSNVCRWSGHSDPPMSVAQHSVYVSLLCSPRDALWGLLHDASEAYIGDVSSPLKPLLAPYKEIEANIMRVICDRFNLPHNYPQSVHEADAALLIAEGEQLMGNPWWVSNYSSPRKWVGRLIPWTPERTRDVFLKTFDYLTEGRGCQ